MLIFQTLDKPSSVFHTSTQKDCNLTTDHIINVLTLEKPNYCLFYTAYSKHSYNIARSLRWMFRNLSLISLNDNKFSCLVCKKDNILISKTKKMLFLLVYFTISRLRMKSINNPIIWSFQQIYCCFRGRSFFHLFFPFWGRYLKEKIPRPDSVEEEIRPE